MGDLGVPREAIDRVLRAILFEVPTFSGIDMEPKHPEYDEPMMLMKYPVVLLRWLLGEFDEWPLEEQPNDQEA